MRLGFRLNLVYLSLPDVALYVICLKLRRRAGGAEAAARPSVNCSRRYRALENSKMHDETEKAGKPGLSKTEADWREELDPHQFHVLGKKELSGPFRENTGTSKMRGFISVLPAERLCFCQRPSTTPVQDGRVSISRLIERQRGRGSVPMA